jgi:hypothetical protein
MRTANYSPKEKVLAYWASPNRQTFIDVMDLDEAKELIEESGVQQDLKIISYFETSGKPVV